MSDLRMPGEDGCDLLRMVKADPVLSSIPVIIHSASVFSPKEQSAVLALGSARVVQVPIEPHLLLAEVADCLKKEQRCEDG